jgi:hypothetical protein
MNHKTRDVMFHTKGSKLIRSHAELKFLEQISKKAPKKHIKYVSAKRTITKFVHVLSVHFINILLCISV